MTLPLTSAQYLYDAALESMRHARNLFLKRPSKRTKAIYWARCDDLHKAKENLDVAREANRKADNLAAR